MKDSHSIHIKIKSYIFNNRRHMNLLTKTVLFTLVLLYITFREGASYIEVSLLLFSIIIVAFLSSPQTIVLDDYGIRNKLGWRESWDNIISYKTKETALFLNTKTNRIRKISNIDEEDLPLMTEFINNKIHSKK
ncbi:hypothetical protein AE938_00250 [Bacteroides fragilis]|nr:hypothetical protein [Bacteroides fragilis]